MKPLNNFYDEGGKLMYDELVKRLKNCATQAAPCETCGLIEDGSCSDTLMKQAADAIEELQKRVPPVPHGRLIDADAFEQHIKKDWEEYDHWIAVEVENRPTVLEAEEGE